MGVYCTSCLPEAAQAMLPAASSDRCATLKSACMQRAISLSIIYLSRASVRAKPHLIRHAHVLLVGLLHGAVPEGLKLRGGGCEEGHEKEIERTRKT